MTQGSHISSVLSCSVTKKRVVDLHKRVRRVRRVGVNASNLGGPDVGQCGSCEATVVEKPRDVLRFLFKLLYISRHVTFRYNQALKSDVSEPT